MEGGERKHKRILSSVNFSAAERPESNVKLQNVTWMYIPRKDQLVILGLCRVFDFLQIAPLQAHMFFQLKSFDSSLSDSAISTQAGFLQGVFTAAQFATAVPWGLQEWPNIMVIFGENNLPGTEFYSCQPSHRYSRPAFQGSESSEDLLEVSVENPHKYELEGGASKAHQPTRVLPFRRIWTSNVLRTLLAQAFLIFRWGVN